MELYRKKFKDMELASGVKFHTTMALANDILNHNQAFNYYFFDSDQDMYECHRAGIFNSNRSNPEGVEKKEYDRFRSSVVNFACLINDPAPLLLFYTPLKVLNPPPLTEEFILSYITYHRQSKDFVLEANGHSVNCIDTWHSFENLEAFQRKYNNWSNCYKHLGKLPFEAACTSCTKNVTAGQNEPCDTCKALKHNYPLVMPHGNPFCNKSFASVIVDIKNDMKESFERRSCMGLQPIQVRQIRSYLLDSTGKTIIECEYHVKLWIMILLSILLFLRFDECCSMKLSHFEKELFCVTEDKILSLAVWVKGKTDKVRQLLAIRHNAAFFEFDLVPLLMIYTVKEKIGTEDFLFPGPNGKGFCRQRFTREVKGLFKTVLKRKITANNIIGTHTWRKTGYAFCMKGKI